MVTTQQLRDARAHLSWTRWMRHLRAVRESYTLDRGAVDTERFEPTGATYAMTRGDRIGAVALAVLMGSVWVLFVIADEWTGRLLGIVGLAYVAWFLTTAAHEGEMSTDGEIRFRGLHREWRCHAEDVRRVAVKSGEGGPMWFAIRTPSGTARLSYSSAGPMVDAILAAKPAVKVRGYQPGQADRQRRRRWSRKASSR